MWPGSMHGSLIWKDCDLLGIFKGTKLPNGWLQASLLQEQCDADSTHASQVVGCSFGVLCRTQHIYTARDYTNNNAVTRDLVLHGHVQCIKSRAQKTNKYKGTYSDCSPAQSLRQQKEDIVMSGAV
ncbi:uncharacterized protein LOC142777472 [Rhipicephalus microplus]|uniref:uncharacterized protein LOC142777472 n=1 Tax=Rhipicephalus microplus TaxID=6941 RepID=UPI003F6B59E4